MLIFAKGAGSTIPDRLSHLGIRPLGRTVSFVLGTAIVAANRSKTTLPLVSIDHNGFSRQDLRNFNPCHIF